MGLSDLKGDNLTFDAEPRKRTRDEACRAAAEIYAHWLANEGAVILAQVAAQERESA